jgi:phosphate uptake regulator
MKYRYTIENYRAIFGTRGHIPTFIVAVSSVPTMETRKVQLSGGTTYTVSLPKSWATEQNIEAGSGLQLRPQSNGSLLIETTEIDGGVERAATVDISSSDVDGITQTIHALYVVGIDSITLVDRTNQVSEREKIVTDLVGRLSGIEVLETTDNEIVLQNLIDAESISIHKSVLRLKLIILAMHRDAMKAMTSGNRTLSQDVIDRDDEADKLFAMVTRYFRRSLSDLQEIERLGHSRDELFEYYYIARQFERVADHAVKIARLASAEYDLGDEVADTLSSYGERARTIVEHAANVVLSDTHVDMAYEATANSDQLVSEIDTFSHDLYGRKEPSEIHRISLLLESTKRTAEYGANIADMAIQQTARRDELANTEGAGEQFARYR